MSPLRHTAPLLLAAALAGCTGNEGDLTLTFQLDPPTLPGEETLACFDFDAPDLAGRTIQGVDWAPGEGPVVLHHATLFAVASPEAAGAHPCADLEGPAVVLHAWTLGSKGIALPEGVALELPDWARGWRVEAHALRLEQGASSPSTVTLLQPSTAPLHLAAWVDDRAPVPKIPPQSEVVSSAICHFDTAAHVVASWPHMHRIGARFRGTLVRKGGSREPLLEVSPWDFDHQLTYPVRADLAPGDGVETECTWDNPSALYVHPGSLSSDEMCNQGLIVWPAAAACSP